jgi:conjugal transfer pilus assembly protein TraV
MAYGAAAGAKRRVVTRAGLVAGSWAAGLAVSLAGCINTEFGCKGYPEGARCQAVSQVVAQDPAETGGWLTATGGRAGSASVDGGAGSAEADRATGGRPVVGEALIQLGKPILKAPEVVRIWLAPWRDDRNRLHEARYVYVMSTETEWAYTGPRVRSARRGGGGGAVLVPRAPTGAGGAGTGAGTGAGGAGTGRPTPQAAGVARPAAGNGAAGNQSPGSVMTGTGATGSAPPAGTLLMTPGSSGPRAVPLPRTFGADGD